VSAQAEAIRLGERFGWVCLPLVRSSAGRKWVPPLKYADLRGERFSLELHERLWRGHEQASGLGAVWPEGIVEAEADSEAGAEWLRSRKLPRTPTFGSRRGPHYLFRGNGSGLNKAPAPGVEVLSAEGKALLVLPPTPPKEWLPSLSPFVVEIAPLPPSLRAAARAGGGEKRAKVPIQLGPALPPGEAHDRMLSIVGRLANVLPREELVAVAVALNAGRLPERELLQIVEDVVAKAGDTSRYFNRPDGFLPAVLGAEILEAYSIRVGPGRHLCWYRDGVFRDTGREQAEAATRRVLGEKFKRRYAEEVVAWLRAEHEQIPEAPKPDLLNVRNGMLDWREGELLPHSPEHLSIVQIPVDWNPEATCPAVDEFLRQVLPEDAQAFIREVIGYCLLPAAPLRKAFLALGPGDNGKSTLLSLIRRLLGRRNASSIPLQLFGESRFAVAGVYGKLANLCGDLDSRALRRSDLFKTLTGGTDAVMGERKFEEPFTFVPFATLIFSANDAPASGDQSDAYFDRWVILPLERRFEGAAADPHLLHKLTTREELEGLLVQAVYGLEDLMERGRFDLPPSVQAGHEQYRQKIDTVATFLEEACELGVDFSATRSVLYEGYRNWCFRNGRMAVAAQNFWPRLGRLLRDEITAGAVDPDAWVQRVRGWRGVGIRA
jgi:P4 family phage/plasmid primase-like protien